MGNSQSGVKVEDSVSLSWALSACKDLRVPPSLSLLPESNILVMSCKNIGLEYIIQQLVRKSFSRK